MVTSVNAGSLAALLAQEQAAANRASGAEGAADPALQPDAAADPAVVYAGAADAPSLSAVLGVTDSLNRAASISDVGISAGQAIAGLVSVLRDKAVAAQGGAGDPQALDADFQGVLATIDQLASSASFQGVTMLGGGSDPSLSFKADLAGETTLSLASQDFTTGGPVLGLAGAGLLGGPDDLQSVLAQIDAASSNLADRLGDMSAQSDQIQAHLGVVSQLQSALSGQAAGADSARLQALAVQQALAGETGPVANLAPQALLSLFRS